jgi:hypothetical protein
MGLAITLWVVGLFIALIVGIATWDDESNPILIILVLMLFGCCGAWSFKSPVDGVDYQIAPYSITVDGQWLYFKSYTEDNWTLSIPSHYYKKIDFVNSWKRCDVPLQIEVPMQIEVPRGYELKIKDNTPKAVPHIVKGGCQ